MKKNKLLGVLEFLKRHTRRFTIGIAILVILLAIISLAPFLGPKGDVVSREELREYMEEYIFHYARLADENMGLLGSHSTNLSRFNYPVTVKGVISLTHGTVVFFNNSKRTPIEVEIREVSESIEYYIWPEMVKDTSDLPIIRILKATECYHLDSPVSYSYGLIYVDPGAVLRYTGKGHAFNITGNGAIVVFGSLIYEDKMTLKGTNSKEDWSKIQARFDALSEFTWDCEDILNATTIESIEAKYKLPILLERIALRFENDRYRGNPGLFTEDFEELKKVHASNETLSGILMDYYTMQKSTHSTWMEQLTDLLNAHMMTIVIGLIVTVIGGIIVALIKKKYITPKEESTRAPLKNRIKEDLRILKDEISSDLKKEAYQSRAFSIDIFIGLRQDLMHELDANTFRIIRQTYTKIDHLRFPSNLQEINERKYKEAIDAIKKTLDLLE